VVLWDHRERLGNKVLSVSKVLQEPLEQDTLGPWVQLVQ
jgi:hypothetical protein